MFFFFSSRRRHTRLQGDWSSDVCSSDLICSRPVWRSLSEELRLMIRTNRLSAALLGLVLAAAACNNDQLNRPFANTPVDEMFARYVSMGNSITAGFQSGGILDSTQQQSYAVLLAREIGRAHV